MDGYQDVFYIFATLTPQGIITDIGGSIFQSSKERVNKNIFFGKNLMELSLWKDNFEVVRKIQNVIDQSSSGKPTEFELILNNEFPSVFIEAKFIPILNDTNEVEKINFFGIDLSEYAKEIDFHKRRSRRLLSAAECAEVGLWYWNVEDKRVITTPRCNYLYGLKPDEVMTYQKFIEAIHPEDVAQTEAVLSKSLTSFENYDVEYRIKTAEDKTIWLSVQGKTIKEDDNSTVMMGSVRDITHRKLADQRIQELYQAEKQTKAEIEELNSQKDHFLAIISHELRSPLQTILGWSKILLTSELDKETSRKALETIENSAKLQAKLISDLVDSAKIISGNLSFSIKPLDFERIVDAVFQSQKPLADEKNIQLVLGNISNLRIQGDSVRLQQAITNLVSNAIKFTPPDNVILIQLSEKNGKAVLSVTDSGTGILEEDIPFIFKQYFQSKSSKNKTGLGLGLSIVKAIIEKHGGEVSAQNNENGLGCTFFITLPIYQSEAVNKSDKSLEYNSAPLKNIKILIVEDNQDSREVLDFYLSRLGATTHLAASAKEGLTYLISEETHPDVIISDISMPEEDGYSFIKKVKNLPEKSSIPAIALTAFASSNDEKRVIAAGFQKYHTKPFEPDLLVSDILDVVAGK